MSPGADVVLRGNRWRVDATVAHDDCCELHLAADGSPRPRILLWPFDRPAPAARPRLVRVVGLPRWARALDDAIASDLDPLTPRVLPRAVDVVPYQLAPALAVAAGASRLLLADEVGLGKTIQAGWIIADLTARNRGARVLIAVPAAVKQQWIDELSVRFGIESEGVDARWLRTRVSDLPVDVSPWAAPAVYVASIDFLKRRDVATAAAAVTWDLLFVDEAHTATAPTERHAALAAIAARARRIVTITATPFSGDAASFRSMTTLGEARDGAVPVMFRRSREDVGDPRVRRHRFTTIRLTRAEARLQRLLERYSRDVWNDAPGDTAGARLAVTILRKRALSSPAAAGRSLRRRLELLSARVPPPRQLTLFEDHDEIEDDLPSAALAAPGLNDAALEQRWLRALIEAADLASTDSKLRFLQRLLRRVRGESLVVFTEYRDTLLHLAAALPPALQLHGGLSASERIDMQARFNRDGGLLLATDAAAEGLNLQGRCRFVINFELPWNPGRLEQRIGRVDRIGQTRTVHALTFTARDTAEDLVIKNLARRLTRVVAALGRGDRLGAFLDDARTASVVIGGAVLPDDPAGIDPAIYVTRARSDPGPVLLAAERLRRAQLSGTVRAAAITSTLVARVRASAAIPPGFVVVLSCSACTGDGRVVSRMTVPLHLSAMPTRPSTASRARELAAIALEAVGRAREVGPAVRSWFAGVAITHAAAVDEAIAREMSLEERPSGRDTVQPGLFDQRAVRASELEKEHGHRLADEHRRHIEALQRARTVRLACEPIAILIAWR